MNSDEPYLTTAEAARRLDVKPETIYAYVSRGQLTSVRRERRRGSLFAQSDVDRLAERGRDGRRPSGAVERIRTELTLLEDDELSYRGHRIGELAGTWSAESVARLLWTGELAPVDPAESPAELLGVARAVMVALPVGARLTDRIRVAVTAVGAADPLRFDLDPAAVVRRAATLMSVLVDALAPVPPRPGLPLAARLWTVLTGRTATPDDVALADTVLVLLADHDLAVSTIAARVAASARAHPYAVVAAGLGAMDGHLHGGASALAYRFLAEALPDAVAALSERQRTGVPVPGLGHRIYQHRDPRADLLLDLLRRRHPDAPALAAVEALVSALPGQFANVDLALAAMAHLEGLPPDAGEAVFGLARIVGWVAHALEEYREPTLRFRVPGVYTGIRPS